MALEVGQSKEDISDCQNRQKYHKMAITSVVNDTSMQSLVWDRVCATGEFICDIPVHKGQSGVTMATNFGTKLL